MSHDRVTDQQSPTDRPDEPDHSSAAPDRSSVAPDRSSVAPDGSPVALYAALGPHDAVELVIDQAPVGGSVLDLGCGAGRLAAPLAEAGLDVTGVDNHAAMLAVVPTTVTSVHADIAGLDLGRPFDVVVLASHLVNHPDLGGDFLATCRRHVAADGVVLVERFAPDLLAHLDAREGAYDGIRVRHELVSHDGDHFIARAHYTVAGTTWVQPYEAVLLGDDDFDVALGAAGLVLWDWVDEDRRWACAVRTQDG